jgi:hypothetical protein
LMTCVMRTRGSGVLAEKSSKPIVKFWKQFLLTSADHSTTLGPGPLGGLGLKLRTTRRRRC